MIPLIKRLIHAFLFDEGAVTGWIRGAALTIGAGGIAFAKQIAEIIEVPSVAEPIKIIAVVCAFVGGAIRAGEKNITKDAPGKPIDIGHGNEIDVKKIPM